MALRCARRGPDTGRGARVISHFFGFVLRIEVMKTKSLGPEFYHFLPLDGSLAHFLLPQLAGKLSSSTGNGILCGVTVSVELRPAELFRSSRTEHRLQLV